jgi:hypothetical protein
MDSINYRPKSRESRAAYEELMAFVQVDKRHIIIIIQDIMLLIGCMQYDMSVFSGLYRIECLLSTIAVFRIVTRVLCCIYYNSYHLEHSLMIYYVVQQRKSYHYLKMIHYKILIGIKRLKSYLARLVLVLVVNSQTTTEQCAVAWLQCTCLAEYSLLCAVQ